MKVVIKEYLTIHQRSPFSEWFDELDHLAAAKVTTALYRLETGNVSNVKSVGGGVLEYKIDFGPGYRVYFAKEELELFILLAGGTKKRQDKDIQLAKEHWEDYKKRKK